MNSKLLILSCLFISFAVVFGQLGFTGDNSQNPFILTSSFPQTPTYNGKALLFKTYALPTTSLFQVNPALRIFNQTVPSALEGFPSFASDLVKLPDGSFFAISNKGPSKVCSNDPTAETLYIPFFAPTAIRFNLDAGAETQVVGNVTVQEKSFYWLRARDGNFNFYTTTGISPVTQWYSDDACTVKLNVNLGPGKQFEDAIDPGAFGVLLRKQFYLIGDGFLPSLVLTDTTGQFVNRFIPTNLNLSACNPENAATRTPFTRNLPSVLGLIRKTRDIGGSSGFSGIAIDENNNAAWAVLRRPLGSDAANSPNLNARIHRVLKLDISDPVNSFATGMYFYETAPLSVWSKTDNTTKVTDIKVTALAQVDRTKFLVLERGKSNSLIYLVDFANATNVLLNAEANYLPVLIYEQRSHLGQKLKNVVLPSKTLILDLSESGLNPSIPVEGLAIVSSSVIALTEDNQWGRGTTKQPFRVHAVQLGAQLPLPSLSKPGNLQYPFSGPRKLVDYSVATATPSPAAQPATDVPFKAGASAAPAPAAEPSVPHSFTINFNFGGIVQQ